MPQVAKQGYVLKRTGVFLLITGFLIPFIVVLFILIEQQSVPDMPDSEINDLSNVISFLPNSEINDLSIVISFLPMVMMLSGALMLSGAFLFWRGLQYAALIIAQEVISDSKPEVLYLRAFKTDPSMARYVFSSLITTISGLVTEEEQLREALQSFGELVAIGKPGESLPTPGAARFYASDDEWQKLVTDHMQSARLVVIRAGIGEGLLWEIKQAVDVVNPEKLLILIMNMKKKHYEAFRQGVEQYVAGSFHDPDEVGRVSGFIRFNKDWQPEFLPLRVPHFRGSTYKPLRRLFQYTLRPVFEQFGVPWQPPSVSILRVSVYFGLLIFFAIWLLYDA